MKNTFALLWCCLCLTGCASHSRNEEPGLFSPLAPEPTNARAASAQPSPAVSPVPSQEVSPAPARLSNQDLRTLVIAANKHAVFGKAFPKSLLQKLRPVEIYRDRANVVIALQRHGNEERGYYIIPPTSSYFPTGHDNGFTWERVYMSDLPAPYSQGVYTYTRTR